MWASSYKNISKYTHQNMRNQELNNRNSDIIKINTHKLTNNSKTQIRIS